MRRKILFQFIKFTIIDNLAWNLRLCLMNMIYMELILGGLLIDECDLRWEAKAYDYLSCYWRCFDALFICLSRSVFHEFIEITLELMFSWLKSSFVRILLAHIIYITTFTWLVSKIRYLGYLIFFGLVLLEIWFIFNYCCILFN